MTPAGHVVDAHVVDVGGVPMSALVAEASQPRAVIVALHGGAVTGRYFDVPGWPRLSLLRTGATLGFTVIALDRPGYGRSGSYADRMASAAQRVTLAYAAVDQLLAARPRGAGVFLMGHSQGCVLAVQMAADDRGADLLGVEIAGTGRAHQPPVATAMAARMDGGPRRASGIDLRDLVWGPAHLYPPGAPIDRNMLAPTPPYEIDDVRGWADDFPALAARVRVPVHCSLGDHERVWQSGPPALAEVSALFTASPRVATAEQSDAGHMLSRGRSAVAYHLSVLSFAEECVLAREIAEASSRESHADAATTHRAGG